MHRCADLFAGRPQLIVKADRVYGVSHTNRVSRVDVVSREDALEFVQSEEQHRQSNEPE